MFFSSRKPLDISRSSGAILVLLIICVNTFLVVTMKIIIVIVSLLKPASLTCSLLGFAVYTV